MRSSATKAAFVTFVVLLGCGGPDAPSPPTAANAVQTPKSQVLQSKLESADQATPSPKLWQDNETETFIRALLEYGSSDSVYLIRWENGDLTGSLKLESQASSEPVSYDLSAPSIQTRSGNAKADGGWLFIGMRRLPDNPDGRDYEVRVEGDYGRTEHMEAGTLRFSQRLNSLRGQLHQSPVPESSTNIFDHNIRIVLERSPTKSFVATKFQDGKDVPWLELKLEPVATTPNAISAAANSPDPDTTATPNSKSTSKSE